MKRWFAAVNALLSPPTFSSVAIGLIQGLESGEVVFVRKSGERQSTSLFADRNPSGLGPFPDLLADRFSLFSAILGHVNDGIVGPGAVGDLEKLRQAAAEAHYEGDRTFEVRTGQLAQFIEASEDASLKPSGKAVFKLLANILRNVRLIPDRNTEGAGVQKGR